MRFLGSKYAKNAFAAGAPPQTPLGELTALLSDPLAGKGGGAPGCSPPEGTPVKKWEEEKGRGRGKGKIVATRCQILRVKCEDALYKCTDLLT